MQVVKKPSGNAPANTATAPASKDKKASANQIKKGVCYTTPQNPHHPGKRKPTVLLAQSRDATTK